MNPVCIIAEAGVNHDGSEKKALRLVDLAAHAGVDVVKFQTFRASEVISRCAAKAEYQKETTGAAESQLEMVRRLELSEKAHRSLLRLCGERRIEFLSTPFDHRSLDFLVRLGVRRLKIPSGEITNAPLLVSAGRTGLPIILSTGMAMLGEIEMALGMLAYGYLTSEKSWERSVLKINAGESRSERLRMIALLGAPGPSAFQRAFLSSDGQRMLEKNLTLLQCTTEYPAPVADVNLRGLETLRTAFGLPVGLSDHTVGIAVSVAAVALGATMIEKHFTEDRSAPGPDHRASLEPDELAAMVRAIREVELAMGSGRKVPAPSELGNREIARKSLVARTTIAQGERFTADNVAIKRPGTGVSPNLYWRWLGRTALRDYVVDELLDDA